jgi:hypothetical protein
VCIRPNAPPHRRTAIAGGARISGRRSTRIWSIEIATRMAAGKRATNYFEDRPGSCVQHSGSMWDKAAHDMAMGDTAKQLESHRSQAALGEPRHDIGVG